MEDLRRELKDLRENMGDNVRVSFKKIEDVMLNNETVSTERLRVEIGSWIGEVYRNVTDICYKRYIKN